MAIPLFNSVKANVNIVSSLDQFIGQLWPAAGTEDDSRISESSVDIFIPPAAVTKFHDVASFRIELRNDSAEACRRIVEAGRKLKKKTTHARTQQIGDVSKIAYQRLGAREPFNMGDKFRDFDGVNKFAATNLAQPSFYRSHRGPGIEGRVQLNGPELLGIVRKPFVGWQIGRIKNTPPVPVKPPRTTDVEGATLEGGI